MVDIGVAGDEQDVKFVPASCGHLNAVGGEKVIQGVVFQGRVSIDRANLFRLAFHIVRHSHCRLQADVTFFLPEGVNLFAAGYFLMKPVELILRKTVLVYQTGFVF